MGHNRQSLLIHGKSVHGREQARQHSARRNTAGKARKDEASSSTTTAHSICIWKTGRGGGGEGAQVPVGAMEPTARPMEDAVKDSRHVMPINLKNLYCSAM